MAFGEDESRHYGDGSNGDNQAADRVALGTFGFTGCLCEDWRRGRWRFQRKRRFWRTRCKFRHALDYGLGKTGFFQFFINNFSNRLQKRLRI